MLRLPKFVTRTLSVRLSLMIVSAITLLLVIALLIMLGYSRRTIKDEAKNNAVQTLEATVEHIDNVLLSVEQTAGNIYLDLLNHLDKPDRMFTYSRKAVETNPYIIGCAAAFEPYYYQEKGQYFMAYVHRTETEGLTATDSPIIQANIFGNRPYNEQAWYTKTIERGRPFWMDPLKDDNTEDEAITTFCLPIYDNGKIVGVLGVDVALNTLSRIALAAKPSPNSYCTLLGSDGSYIIHPDTDKLFHQTVFTQTEKEGTDPSVKEAGEAMVSGETGYKSFRLNGMDNYVFYKPFKRAAVQGRSMENLGWSVGIIYPKDDIFGDYYRLLYYILFIAIAGIVLLFLLCWGFTHHELMPLRLLTKTAQRIAEGHFDEPIPESHQQDEIGRLQNHFGQMQQALAIHVSELERLTTTLQERGEVLQAAYEQAKEANNMKTAFLHNMTNQMIPPVNVIETNVNALCANYDKLENHQAGYLVNNIQQQGKAVTELLNSLLSASEQQK